MDNRLASGDRKTSRWGSAAKGVAFVSGTFSLIVAALLVFSYITEQSGLPEKELFFSRELAEKKELLEHDPRSEELKQEIRSLDLSLRQEYFGRREYSERGKYLLLAGISVFLLAIKRMMAEWKPLRKPRTRFREPNLEARRLAQARQAVGLFGFILLCCVLALIWLPRVELPEPSTELTDANESASSETISFPGRDEIQENWPMFRGPGGLGLSSHANVPTSWNEESGEGILWKSEVTLPGNNSPIVWGNRLFFSGASEEKKAVFCYSTISGELLWTGSVDFVPGNSGEELSVFEDTGYAASTMACDGSRVYAIFIDGDMACFDFEGERLWAKNLGTPDSMYGFATSLAFFRNRLLLQYDQGEVEDEISRLYSLEGKTGQVAYQKKRPVANSWTSPILIDTDEGEQFITCSEPWVISYDPETGEELWRADLLGTDLAPSACYADGLVFVLQPYETLFALRTDGKGDVTETHVAWKFDCPAPDICSPVSKGDMIFLLTSTGLLTCHDTQSGEVIWEHEFDDTFLASLTIAGDWLYLFSDKGVAYRIKASRQFEEAGKSYLLDRIVASPAFTNGRIFVRGEKSLYCIGSE